MQGASNHDSLAFVPACPRCGYDLSGVPSSWKDSCPVRGVCPECGLEYDWCDVLDPSRAVPPWLFESAVGARVVPFVRTYSKACRPRRFWHIVRLHYGVRLGRLAWFAAIVLLFTYLACVLQHAVFIARAFLPNPAGPGTGGVPALEIARLALLPFDSAGSTGEVLLANSPWFLLGVLMFVTTPMAYMALPITLQRCRVRAVHIVRIAAYSLVGLPPILLVLGIASLLTPPGWWSPSGIQLLFLHFGALPLALTAWLTYVWTIASWKYLKLPRVLPVVAAMVTIGFLASAAFVAFLHPGAEHNPVTYWLMW